MTCNALSVSFGFLTRLLDPQNISTYVSSVEEEVSSGRYTLSRDTDHVALSVRQEARVVHLAAVV